LKRVRRTALLNTVLHKLGQALDLSTSQPHWTGYPATAPQPARGGICFTKGMPTGFSIGMSQLPALHQAESQWLTGFRRHSGNNRRHWGRVAAKHFVKPKSKTS
jgi:hypothetical protein